MSEIVLQLNVTDFEKKTIQCMNEVIMEFEEIYLKYKSFINNLNITCSFSSSFTIYETQYKCTLREDEFNLSLNPSLISGSEGIPYSYTTGSYFSPYITTIGLYDENQNLLAIGKLAQPIPTSPTTDTTILINIDK